MKKLILLFLVLVCLFVFLGCGEDGEDGKSYIAIDWVYTPLSYWDNNSAIPSPFYGGKYYQSKKGTYDFSYTAWDGSAYAGTYTIKVEKGESAELFSDGKDGEDRHYDLWLYSIGPDLYVSGALREKEELKAQESSAAARYSDTMDKSDMKVSSEDASLEPVFHVIEQKSGDTTFRLEYRKVIQ